ncbi:hypothetical protein [Streptomyces sp. CRN 30]|uniref:hypothetical protein n=1 Tax=Streptomyces sp. CRN 30 TaxID=3075613 RepID=UPI002A7EDBE7|nr:hypothetical protein [Streptomyces sp. CRN 30]
MSTPSNTENFTFTPGTPTLGHIVDDGYTQAIQAAQQGGDPTQQWFDCQNQTSDFWGWMADPGADQFAPGQDPDGNQILMAQNYGVQMRQGAFYRGDDAAAAGGTAGDSPPQVGLATIDTYNTTNDVSKTITYVMSAAGIVPSAALTKALFGDLIQPTLKNCATFVRKMSQTFQQEAQAETPNVDPLADVQEPMQEAEEEAEEATGEIVEQGVEYLSVSWSSVALECAGLGAVAVLPLIFGAIGHNMLCHVEIHNLTDIDFTWNLDDQVHGKASVLPQDETARQIPKMDYAVDHWGDRSTVQCAYFATFGFINSYDLGDIGVVLSLTPSDGSPEAKLVAAVPYAGDNTIWVGQSDDDPATIYAENSVPNGLLQTACSFDTYSVSWAITKLSGTTGGAYYYGLMGVINPPQ